MVFFNILLLNGMFLSVTTDDKEGENKNEKHLYFKS